MDDDQESTGRSVRLPSFSGKTKDFMIWWIRFRAFATVYRFVEALRDADEASLPAREDTALDEAVPAEKLSIPARKRNAVAMANYSMAMTAESNLGMIFKAITAEWPAGKASIVTRLLKAKYMPQDTMTPVELRQELNKIKMKKNEDPAALFEHISSVTNRYNTSTSTIQEEDMIAVILDAAPAEYQTVLTSEQRVKGTALKQADLEEAMNQHWRQIKKRGGEAKNKEDSELTLASITCYACHETGHKANKCPRRQEAGGRGQGGRGEGRGGRRQGRGRGRGREGRGFSGNCNHCGKPGHRAATCWEKSENAHLRPVGYVTAASGEAANANVDGAGRLEYLLMAKGSSALTFPNDQSFLEDPNVWIAGTAATVHTTPHIKGCVNIRAASRADSIMVGNGSNEFASQIVDIPGAVCDKHGNELTRGTLKDATLLPHESSIFSVCPRC
jgi:hypothetical protein